MKKFKIAVALSCALTMVLALSLNSLGSRSNQAINTQKAYTQMVISPCNNGDPAI